MEEKPFKSLDELVALLTEERGLICPDKDELKRYLSRTNYYRFSGYFRQFQIAPSYGDNRFEEGTSFAELKDITQKDEELRRLLSSSLSVVEVGVRAALAHQYGKVYGPDAFYLDTDAYNDAASQIRDIPLEIVNGIVKDLDRADWPMVNRYVHPTSADAGASCTASRYAKLPIWVAVEAISFGKISNMLANFKDFEPAKAAAKTFEIQWQPFASTIHALHYLRNICAHHRQLWNRRPDVHCGVPIKYRPRNVKYDSQGFYPLILMLNLYRKKIDGDAACAERINELINYSDTFAEGLLRPQPK